MTYYISTVDREAVAGSDYVALDRVPVTVDPRGMLPMSITILGDRTFEYDEAIRFLVYETATALTPVGDGEVVLQNDDHVGAFSVQPASVAENAGSVTITVTREGGLAPATVAYTANFVTASENADYGPVRGTLSFGEGVTSRTFTIPIYDDAIYEGDEYFSALLYDPSGDGSLARSSARVTILENDPVSAGNPYVGTFSISDVTVVEGASGTVFANFVVSREYGLVGGVSINYTTGSGSAYAGSDFIAQSGTLTFGAGVTSQSISVAVLGDLYYEPDEYFFVTIGIPAGGSIRGSGRGMGTILNDDVPVPFPILSVGDIAAFEGQNGTTGFVFTVTLGPSGPLQSSSTVSYLTADGTATAASGDYTPTSGLLIFPRGTTSQTITVMVNGDQLVESDESFLLQFGAPTYASFAGGASTFSVTGTIRNDDFTDNVTISNVAVAEGNSGTTNAVLTVTRTGGTSAFSVNYATADIAGGATAGLDYIATAGTLTFAQGQNSATISVPVRGDTLNEGNEAFSVVLSGANNGVSLGTTIGVVTIIDDDFGVTRTSTSANDTFVVTNALDIVADVVGGGFDAVYAQVSYVLPPTAEIEVLSAQNASAVGNLNLTGNGFAQTIVGDYGANVLTGGGGADTLSGLRGDDTYVISTGDTVIVELAGEGSDTATISAANYLLAPGASVERLEAAPGTASINIAGNELNQTIVGNAGANILSGNGGDDTLDGGAGDDIYRVFSTGTVLLEAAGGGFDTVYASGTSYFLYSTAEIEYLSPAQQGATDPIYLVGNAASQVIVGNYGNNILNGRGGGNNNPDTLIGLYGDDVFGVFTQGDVVREVDGQGTDVVYANGSYQLRDGTSVETLSAVDQSASDAMTLRGNEVAQQVVGNQGANVLDGRGGNDTLIGLGGADTFAFTTALGASNVDTIRDFLSGTDRIGLASDVFAAVTSGGILASEFLLGMAAADDDDRPLYDQATGRLFYDADANGPGAAVLFAQLAAGTALSAADFTVIAPVASLAAA